jgi:alkaline phosphatase
MSMRPMRSMGTGALFACASVLTLASSSIAACSGDDNVGVTPNDGGGGDGSVRADGGQPPSDSGHADDGGSAKDASRDASPDAGPQPAACAPDVTTGGAAKNIVFFLGDGMGIPVLTAARIYAVGEEGSLTIDTLPETGFVRTYSKSHMVTDSAPSMSAYMTGVKMNNDVLAMTPDTVADPAKCIGASSFVPDAGVTQNGMAVTTILEMAKKAGKSVGVVTTTRVTHATPAATYAHICNRDLEFDIAAQAVPGGAEYNAALMDGIDVLLGGGKKQFDTNARPDHRDLLAELTAENYAVVTNATDLAAFSPTSTKKLFGAFATSHMSYEVDRVIQNPIVEPSLTDMTMKAIAVLSKNPNGFFLMVEGGRIDHALHETRARRALEETVAFDNAIKAALTKVDLGKTLVVVTADHDHTMIHNGYAHRVGKTTPTNAGILGFVHNYEAQGDAGFTPALDYGGVPYAILGFTNGPNRVSGPRVATGFVDLERDAEPAPLDETLTSGLAYRQEATIRMSMPDSETHGGTDVSIWATGASAEQVHGFLTNTTVFSFLRCGAGL